MPETWIGHLHILSADQLILCVGEGGEHTPLLLYTGRVEQVFFQEAIFGFHLNLLNKI